MSCLTCALTDTAPSTGVSTPRLHLGTAAGMLQRRIKLSHSLESSPDSKKGLEQYCLVIHVAFHTGLVS